jgi:hypothetical protein
MNKAAARAVATRAALIGVSSAPRKLVSPPAHGHEADMYFIEALHDGTPWFLLAVFALLVTVAMN